MKNYRSILKSKLIRSYAIIDEWLDFPGNNDRYAEEELITIVELILSDVEGRLSNTEGLAESLVESKNIIRTCPRLSGCCSPAMEPDRQFMVRRRLRRQLEACLLIVDLIEADATAFETVAFIVEEIFNRTFIQKEYRIDARSTFSEQL